MSDFLRARGEGCLSDLTIDRSVRGELTGEAAAAAQAHLATCAQCRARVGEVEATRAAFQAAPPVLRSTHADAPAPMQAPQAQTPQAQTPQTQTPQTQPARPRRRWSRWTAGAGAGLAAAAALAFMLRTNEGTRTKGGDSRVAFYVEHNREVRRGAQGEAVAPGDTVQLVYTSAEPCYGAILSVDGAHHVSRYLPDVAAAARPEPGSGRSSPPPT